jgi:hypothetical protein
VIGRNQILQTVNSAIGLAGLMLSFAGVASRPVILKSVFADGDGRGSQMMNIIETLTILQFVSWQVNTRICRDVFFNFHCVTSQEGTDYRRPLLGDGYQNFSNEYFLHGSAAQQYLTRMIWRTEVAWVCGIEFLHPRNSQQYVSAFQTTKTLKEKT